MKAESGDRWSGQGDSRLSRRCTSGPSRGPAEAQRFLEDFWRNFEQFRTDIEEYIPVGDSVVFAAHLQGKGKGSGVEVEMRNWQVCTIRDRKVVAYRMFTTKLRALEAAGLSE